MELVLISIIVPVYNIEEYILECIESILKQTYKNLQIILVDDGSTDQSGKICDEYAAKDQRIEVIHQQNQGLVTARKSGLKLARGKYIGFVDGDDLISSDMYQKLVEKVELYKADFVSCGYWENGKEQVINAERIVDFQTEDRLEFIINSMIGLSYGMATSVWTKLFKNELIKKCYLQVPDKASYGEDLIALFACILSCDKIVLMDESYYYYRIRQGSLAHQNKLELSKKMLGLYRNVSDILEKYHCFEELDDAITKYFVNRLIYVHQKYFVVRKYYYEHTELLSGKEIVIYGAGTVGRDYYVQISSYMDCTISAWVDAAPERYEYPHIRLYRADILKTLKFDVLIIAVLHEDVAAQIRNQLLEYGIASEKIFWSIPRRYDAI